MKNTILFILLILLFTSCSSNDIDDNSLLPKIPVNEEIFLNNPQFIDLQVVGGWAYTQGGINGIIVYHSGINRYTAWERSAPHYTPQACSKMTVKNGIVMFCSCDKSEFNILNGAPLTDGVKYPARQYRAVLVGNTLQITNFRT